MPARVFAGAPRRSLSSHGPRVRPPPFPSPLNPCLSPLLPLPLFPLPSSTFPTVLAQVNSHVVAAPSVPQDAAHFSPENIFKGHLTPLPLTFCKRPDTLPAAESGCPQVVSICFPSDFSALVTSTWDSHTPHPTPRPRPALLVALTCQGLSARTLSSSCPTSGFCCLCPEQLNLRLCCGRWLDM